MEAALRILLPKIVGEVSFEVYPYQCKEDLLSKLPDRLRGYSRFLPSDWKVVVVADRDGDDCRALKEQLERAATFANLTTKTKANGQPYCVVNRLAIEELEAWYFGDWEAARQAFPKLPEHLPNKAGFRDPDAIAGGTWEAFERICQKVGYFKGGLRKIEAAQRITTYMIPERSTSRSFQALRNTLLEFTNE